MRRHLLRFICALVILDCSAHASELNASPASPMTTPVEAVLTANQPKARWDIGEQEIPIPAADTSDPNDAAASPQKAAAMPTPLTEEIVWETFTPTEPPTPVAETMWVDDHPYFLIYLIGCAFVVALTLFKMALFSAIGWITKSNTLAKNLKKLSPPDKDTFIEKATAFLVTAAFEVALSWINVVISLWQITVTLLRTIREAFSATPEEIKLLRFPLMNNPELPPESVWAHLTAVKIKAGMVNYSTEIARDLVGLPKSLTSFDSRTALAQLERLHAVAPEWMPDLRRCAEDSWRDHLDNFRQRNLSLGTSGQDEPSVNRPEPEYRRPPPGWNYETGKVEKSDHSTRP